MLGGQSKILPSAGDARLIHFHPDESCTKVLYAIYTLNLTERNSILESKGPPKIEPH